MQDNEPLMKALSKVSIYFLFIDVRPELNDLSLDANHYGENHQVGIQNNEKMLYFDNFSSEYLYVSTFVLVSIRISGPDFEL